MKVRQDKLYELMNTYAQGNYNRFARELSIDPSHLHRFLTKDIGGGKKLVGAVLRFCKANNLDFEEYIEL